MVDVLSDEDVAYLTGRKQRALQIAQLTLMNLPFVVNVTGYPLVPVSAIEGTKKQARADVDELVRKVPERRAVYAVPAPRRPAGE